MSEFTDDLSPEIVVLLTQPNSKTSAVNIVSGDYKKKIKSYQAT